MGDNWGKYLAKPKREHEILERLANKRYPRTMDTKEKQEQKRRETILAFWKKHGLQATKDAFKVSRATLFRWQQESLPRSRTHRNGYQKRSIHPLLKAEIMRLRKAHPRLGKEKLTPLLRNFCVGKSIPAASEATVGRMVGQLKQEGILPTGRRLTFLAKSGTFKEKEVKRLKKLRRKGYMPECPGDLMQLDGVLVNTLGKRRYTFTAVDLVSRWAFSKTYKTTSSRNGANFLNELIAAAPFEVSHIQTDNGSEFMKEFREAASAASLVHFFNFVKQPKYQGWIERFNRTIQEEFLDWHQDALALEPEDFNPELLEWLSWYNTERVHRSLGKPGQRLTPLQYLETTTQSH
jgi:putative transposase